MPQFPSNIGFGCNFGKSPFSVKTMSSYSVAWLYIYQKQWLWSINCINYQFDKVIHTNKRKSGFLSTSTPSYAFWKYLGFCFSAIPSYQSVRHYFSWMFMSQLDLIKPNRETLPGLRRCLFWPDEDNPKMLSGGIFSILMCGFISLHWQCGYLENSILIIRINILAIWDPLALTQGPGRCYALPKVTLGAAKQHFCPLLFMLHLGKSLFSWSFMCGFHYCICCLCSFVPFCKPVFLLLQAYLAVFNCTTLLLHHIGLSL